MTYKNLSLLFITTLLTLVLASQWFAINQSTQLIADEIGKSAFEVSRATAEKLIFSQPKVIIEKVKLSPHSPAIAVTTDTSDKLLLKEPMSTRKTIRKTQHISSNLLQQFDQEVTIELINRAEDKYLILQSANNTFQVPIPRTGIEESLENLSNQMFYVTFGLLILGVCIAIIFVNTMLKPLLDLQQAAKQIATGNFGHKIKSATIWQPKEIKQTHDSFNQMSSQIQSLQQNNQRLQEQAQLSELAEIARGIAHTIRNPLNTLSFAIEQLAEASDKRTQTIKTTQIAKQQISRIDRWVKSLMTVMNNDATLIKTVDLDHLLVNLIAEIKPGYNKDIIYRSENKAVNLMLVESEIKGILQCLIVNALENKASTQVTINLGNKASNENLVKLEIKDNGTGLSESIKQNLFKPHNTNKTYGAGMGLYLAHRVITLKYAGSISLTNTEDGCVCLVTLKNRE
ncbi:ATP-binding protein [Aliikangiella sp. IMCC44653]